MSDLVISDVARLSEAVGQARKDLADALARRDGAIRQALSVGYKPGVVADAAELSRQQLKNIRKGGLT